MTDTLYQFVSLDLPALLAATLAALSCGLLGNFLLLRRLSLMGDAISHAVLPGLVVAFLLTQSRTMLPMFLGALAAGLATAVIVELIRKLGRVESGAAMGVTFSILFALGVLLMEQAAAANVDLDAECVLHGQLETIFWFPPREVGGLFTLDTLAQVPRQVTVLAGMALVVIVFITLFFKELRVAAFDPELSTSVGIPAGLMHYLLMILVAGAAVASFEAVGSILVVAMLICPAATARLLTDRLVVQVFLSALVAIATGILGYGLGALAPTRLGLDHALNAAGSMTVVAGVLLAAAITFSPQHGLIAKRRRRRRLAGTVAVEDLLGLIYRFEETRTEAGIDRVTLEEELGDAVIARRAVRRGLKEGWVRCAAGRYHLTRDGYRLAASIVRSHRRWETYLTRELGLPADHVHDSAAWLEHLRRGRTPERLEPPIADDRDPHGRPIPPEDER